VTPFEEEKQSAADPSASPPSLAVRSEDRQRLRQALEGLPPESREVLVLREFEGFSYKDIARIAGIPQGTVMSRLARARERLQQTLAGQANKDR
jgi:RNA polymerase sigma-70 factor (ECF subfamily)